MSPRKFVLSALVGIVVGFCVGRGIAHADSGSGSASVIANGAVDHSGSGSGSAASSPASTATTLHDPTTDPLGAISDARDAKSKGWPLLVLVVLIALTKSLSFVGGKLAPLGKFLAKGKNAMIVAGVGTVLAACYNVLAAGGSWYAVLMAAGAAGLALISSHAPATAVEKHEAA
jgi:hypothetical protein